MFNSACRLALQRPLKNTSFHKQIPRITAQIKGIGSLATIMKPSEIKYRFIEGVERLDYYVPGGYHPVNIGDTFCAERYTVVHKLGFGRSATTWLAEDRQQMNKLVALKISTAESAQ